MTTYKHEHEPDYTALERYWLGEATPEETTYIESWFAARPQDRNWFEQMRQGLKDGRWVSLSRDDIAVRAEDVMRNTGIVSSGDRLSAANNKPAPRLRGWYAASSVMLGIAMIAVGWFVNGNIINSNLTAHTSVYATANGERATVTLPDGSTATLNVGSQLRVPSNYAMGNRTVELQGEALFSVTNHSDAPFTVEAGPSVTRVLGTQFTVRHYSTDTIATVAVREGKVMVQSEVLTQDQMITVGASGAGKIKTIQPGMFSFNTGVLALNPMPLSDAIVELNRWYDIDIRLGNSALQKERISGRFAAGSVSDLIEHLEWTFNFRVVREGRVLTLYRGS